MSVIKKATSIKESVQQNSLFRRIFSYARRYSFYLSWMAISFLFFFIVLIFVIAFWQDQLEEVAIPDLKGMEITKAILQLQESGFRYQIIMIDNPSVKRNFIIDQRPEPGAVSKEGRTIQLNVSSGVNQEYKVPNFIGKEITEAIGMIGSTDSILENGLYLKSVIFSPSKKNAGLVFDQKPSPESRIDGTTGVILIVGKGSFEKSLKIPDFKDEHIEYAMKILNDSQINVILKSQNVSGKRDGLVQSQSVSPGKELTSGDRIELTVGIANEKASRWTCFEFTLEPSLAGDKDSAEIMMKLSAKDKRYLTIYDGRLGIGISTTECFIKEDFTEVQVYINNSLFKEFPL